MVRRVVLDHLIEIGEVHLLRFDQTRAAEWLLEQEGSEMDEEIPLTGGRVTLGVVRSGDSVRRSLGKDSRLVHELPRRLESVQFSHAPRYLGIDSRGRDILTFVDGLVPPNVGQFSGRWLAGRCHSRRPVES